MHIKFVELPIKVRLSNEGVLKYWDSTPSLGILRQLLEALYQLSECDLSIQAQNCLLLEM